MAECPTCSKELENEHGVKIHHQTVHNESLALKTYECEWCGKKFQRYKSKTKQSDHIFCSDECEGKRRTHNWPSEKQANWSGGKNEYVCKQCGDTVMRYERKVKNSENTFCSYKCQGKWISENKSGENHWHYNGKSSVQYGQKWVKQRKKAIKRDDEQCQDCGLIRSDHYDEYGRDLEVHHITPIRTFSDTEKANQLSNLITLCKSCHIQRENNTG